MSHRLFDLNPELKRLRDEGYNVEVRNGFLIMHDVPYVTASKLIRRGFLATTLLMANDRTQPPDYHTIHFGGEYPCDKEGRPIERIRHNDSSTRITDNLVADRTFSAKPQPTGSYESYYAKVTTYADILSGPARQIDPSATAKTFPHIPTDDSDSVFRYLDTASSRAEITAISDKLKIRRVAIVGLGGTGGYVLDLLAKTPVQEIHLFDGDVFFQHNAFRAPGAAAGSDLEQKPQKVDYFQRLYDRMRKGIVAHAVYVTSENLDLLEGFDFVFLCMEGGDKAVVVKKLEALATPFIDVGMGLYLANSSLGGIVRTTTSVEGKREHVWEKKRIPFATNADRNEYDLNIQIADLNALNAALAVIRWKRLVGFYLDQEKEFFSTYTIGGNDIANEDQ
jgi:ThiF family